MVRVIVLPDTDEVIYAQSGAFDQVGVVPPTQVTVAVLVSPFLLNTK